MHALFILLIFYSYDVIFTDNEETILKKYDELNATILFSSEDFCWPDGSLKVCSMIFSDNTAFPN